MITHKWIPTSVGLIAPHEVVRDIHLLAPRADFNAALLQFLIGLVQTTMAPQNERAWKNIYKNPPSESDLQAAFAPLISTFDYKIFMQDFAEFDGKTNNISGLLPETPGDQTCRLDTDFFVKRDTVKHLCKSCTATALLSHNLNASSDGVGYRTGLRGGGPLTTIAIGDTLWETIWLNILETPDLGDSESDEIFPWMCPTHTAEVHSAEVNPLLMYWAMPRRIHIDWDTTVHTTCDICGQMDDCITEYSAKNYGNNYKGSWRHPLSPYYTYKEETLPVHANPGGVTYKHWLGLLYADQTTGYQAALIINKVLDRYSKFKNLGESLSRNIRISAFGYDFDNAKVRTWYESTMPIIHSNVPDYETNIAKLVHSAATIISNTKSCVKSAYYGKAKVRGDLSPISIRMWAETEDRFYKTIHQLSTGADVSDEWLSYLKSISFSIFDELTDGAPDPKRIVEARKSLYNFNNKSVEKIWNTQI